MKRVLVTGASGFIGRGSLTPLLQLGWEVHAVSRHQRIQERADVHWHVADLLDDQDLDQLLSSVAPTHLLHLAWFAEPGAFWGSVENLRWVEASLRLLRRFSESGGRRAVIAGTCAEYEWRERTNCVEATTPLNPSSLYGVSKHALHLVAERYAAQAGFSLAWGRIFFVFGPHEHPSRLAASVVQSLLAGREAPCSHGQQVRDFIYSEDLAAAFVALLDSPVDGAVNLGSGTPLRIADLVCGLAAACRRSDLLRLGARASAPGEPAELVADITRLRREVGWTPERTVEERVVDMVEWWRDHLTAGEQPRRRG